jgi:hypothetical protein
MENATETELAQIAELKGSADHYRRVAARLSAERRALRHKIRMRRHKPSD